MCDIMYVSCIVFYIYFFFFKQKTAYEMRISDWSSDVCSSDLVGLLARDHLVTDREALRRDDIGQLVIGVLHQRDERGAVGIVFDPLDRAFDIPFAALEIDETIALLVAAGDAARGDRKSHV